MSKQKIKQMVVSNRQEFKRFFKFAIVGAMGSVTDISVLNLLVQLVGLNKIAANMISVSVAIVQNFLFNRYWTFPESRKRSLSTQLVQFALVNLAGLGINTLIFGFVDHLLIGFWQTQFGDSLGFTISYNFAKLFAIGVVLFWNFAANRLWTYRGLSTLSPESGL